MVRGIFIKEGIKEGNTWLGNWAWIWDEGTFTQGTRSLVFEDQIFHDLIAFFCCDIYDFSIFKGHFDPFDNVSIVAKRFCRSYIAFCTTEVRSCKDLFCRHVWQEAFTLGIDGSGRFPDVVLRQAKSQISPRSCVMKGWKLFLIQCICLALENSSMLFPSLNWIFLIHSTSLEDLIPQEIHCFFITSRIWEDLFRPF